MVRKIFLLAGLGYGDEGKGTTTDWLTSYYPVKSICRYNGGPQAAHHAVSGQGTTHCFSQLGSGLLSAPVSTYLTRFMTVNPMSLMEEYKVLQSKIEFTIPEIYIDSQCLIVTPYHILINQMREISRGVTKHGSCGRGVGETIKEAKRHARESIRAQDLGDLSTLRYKLRFWQTLKIDEGEQLLDLDPTNLELLSRLEKMRSEDYFLNLVDWYIIFSKWTKVEVISNLKIDSESDIIYEGAQGALLHRDYGFYPHVTQSDTSFNNAEELIHEQNLSGQIFKIGIIRAYATRHGAGPFVTYDSRLTALIPDQNNITNDWQGDFKIGWLDLVATRYALKIVGEIDGIAITNLDRLQILEEVKVCNSYKYFGQKSLTVIEKFFDCEVDGVSSQFIITGIKLLPVDNLNHYDNRQSVTNILNDCKPVYQTIKVNNKTFIDDYTDYLEQALKIKVLLTSTGPGASEKKIMMPLTK